MEEGSIAKVINDFLSLKEGELSLIKGDIVQIIKVKDAHWCYGYSAGKQGLIPTNYLMELDDPLLEGSQELFVALADFPAQEPGDLFFKKGELIIGLSPEDDNWWKGKIGDRVGVFPKTYVWQLNSEKFKSDPFSPTVSMKAIVKTSMKAQLDEEMDLNEGDIVTITGVVDKTWYRGACGNREGIFPKDFVMLLTEHDVNLGEDLCNNPLTTGFSSQPSYSSDLAEFPGLPSYPFPSQDTSSKPDSLITFSPDEPKKLPSSRNLSCDLTSFDSDLYNGLFASVNDNKLSSAYGAFDEYGGHNDNGGLSPYGITLYPFYGQFDNELSFHEGEIVTLLRHVDDDWIEGEIEGRKGILPVSYVKILIDCGYSMGENTKSGSSKSSANSRLRLNSSAKVVYNFRAQMNGDISVTEGEVVFITEVVNEDWCRVRNSEEVVGLCPSNHLAPLSASEELIGLQIPQSSSFSDSLPSYNDVCITSEHNINRLSFGQTKGETYNRSPDFTFVSRRPKSVDDMIAKNIAGLNLNLKAVKEPREDAGTSLLADSNLGLCKKYSSSDLPSEEILQDSQSSGQSIQDSSELSPTASNKPATAASVTCAETHGGSDSASSGTSKKPSDEEGLSSTCRVSDSEVEFRRHGSDRLPHRPAPPIPVPGQTPVRRTLPRKHHLSRKSSSSKTNFSRTLSLREQRKGEQSCSEVISGQDDQRVKDSEHRQNVISELVITEKEYVRDLKLTYETFHLHNEEFLESRGIDVNGIFGNITEVMQIAETLLDKILFSMKNKGDDEQLVGPCFLELADEMKIIYSSYCMNHDTALTLLEKYESNENIQRIFDKGIETLRYQVACFDMGSILIKPVQRILKYPLILNELIKYTEESHTDRPLLLEAVKRMTEVALHINEFKRRKDLVSKYLDNGNATLTDRMSKLSLHSVLKKSSRLGMKLSSSLGIGLIAKDPEFDAQEVLFRSLEKSVKAFMRNAESFYSGLEEVTSCQCSCGEMMYSCFDENKCSGVNEFKEAQKVVFSKYLGEFRSIMDSCVLKPLSMLIDLFEGPERLIQKRNDKLLDYNRSLAKSEKNRESKLIQDEILLSKNNYDALNSQLLEELPKLTTVSYELFMECIAEFISARKLFTGRATKQYLLLCENHLFQSQGDILEVFAVKHSLVSNQIGRFSFVTKNFSYESNEMKCENKSPILGADQKTGMQKIFQNNSQRVYLQSRYPREKLFVVKDSYASADPLDLPVSCGTLVAVIKNQDPMGNTKRWFVDSGGTQGFLPATILEPCSAVSSADCRNSQISASVGHGNSSQSLLPEKPFGPDIDKKSKKTEAQSKEESTYNLPPTYEEVVEPHLKPHDNSEASMPANHRYEEPHEESPYSSHMYAEIPDEDNSPQNEFYYALYDFSGNGLHTLPITQGQVLKVKSYKDLLGNSEWWLVENRAGKSGYVPGNYLKKYS